MPNNRHSARAKEHFEDTATSISEGVQEVGNAVKRMASDGVNTLRETAGDYVDQGKAKARELGESLEDQVRDQPMKALLVSAAAGFLLGIFFMRR